MKPNCPIPQWEHSFATEYCKQIKSLGPMWRKNVGFGAKTLDQFKVASFHLCALTKQCWFPGCPGSHFEHCRKFLYLTLQDWKKAFESKQIEKYPIAYFIGMVKKNVRGGDWYFETLKRRTRKAYYEVSKSKKIVEIFAEALPYIPKEEVQEKRDQLIQQIRWQVLQRDNHHCRYCGSDINDGVKLHVDHVIPLSRGGTNDLDNLVTSCQDCNVGKGADVSSFSKIRFEDQLTLGDQTKKEPDPVK